MKSWMWILVGGVIILVIVAVLIMRPSPVVAPQTTATPLGDSGPQFLQQEPEFVVPSVSPSPSPSTSPVVSGSTVSISDTGFSPSNVNITSGTTVTFTNNGQALHWPASDPHPTHGGLAGFDAKKGLATGETYSYTFTKVGSFGFHDHLNPSLKGTVVVK